jgi:uncharacterized membrane-anchored protein
MENEMAIAKQKCWNCRSDKYEQTARIEECTACGIRCDYWGGGANKAYDSASARKHAAKARASEARAAQWAKENGYD